MKQNTKSANLQVKINRILAKPPRAGNGVHRWLFVTSLKLHRLKLTPTRIEELLTAAVRDCGRQVPISEILDAVQNSSKLPTGARVKFSDTRRKQKKQVLWPEVNERERENIIHGKEMDLAIFSGTSPHTYDVEEVDTKWYLMHLFNHDDLICIGKNPSVFNTLPLHVILRSNIHLSTLIVPSPMTEEWGITKQGKVSRHTLANTGPRRFLVTEFDTGSPDSQASLIHHLQHFAPLVMVVSSGGKSLHAWWYFEYSTEKDQLDFFRYAVSLGADPATWTRSQFVRIPLGWREDKKALQHVYYFNPGILRVRGNGGLK